MSWRKGPPLPLAEQVHGQTLTDHQREIPLAQGTDGARVEEYIFHPGVSDAQAGPLLREFVQLFRRACFAPSF